MPKFSRARQQSAKSLGVLPWQQNFWLLVVEHVLAKRPGPPNLSVLEGFNAPAVTQYTVTTPDLLRSFRKYNDAKPYHRQVSKLAIRAFFTRISKLAVRDIVSNAVRDDEFMLLFDAAIKVELANLADLRDKAKLFPIEDIGVAQGNSLSPLLGNILLRDFDKVMNEGDCRCIRYIDDFIILAPTKKAAATRIKKAIKILSDLGMELSPEKSSQEPCSIQASFEFLGIEFSNGLIRPSPKSHQRLISQVNAALQSSLTAFRAHRAGHVFPKSQSLISTLIPGRKTGPFIISALCSLLRGLFRCLKRFYFVDCLLGKLISVRRRLLVPLDRLIVILGHAPSIFIKNADGEFGGVIVLRC